MPAFPGTSAKVSVQTEAGRVLAPVAPSAPVEGRLTGEARERVQAAVGLEARVAESQAVAELRSRLEQAELVERGLRAELERLKEVLAFFQETWETSEELVVASERPEVRIRRRVKGPPV